MVVGRGGLEPPTSRLSGVRSNHLSYRPKHFLVKDQKRGVQTAYCRAMRELHQAALTGVRRHYALVRFCYAKATVACCFRFRKQLSEEI